MTNQMNYRKTLSYREVAQQAQKLSEMAYLEACQPKRLQNQVLMDYCFKEAKRLTNRLKNAGYWKSSVISLG
jgi:hypothetical protein